MKIGIFDSGLGGLIITRSIIKKLPDYDYIFLGDTARVPYGNRSQSAIYQFTKEMVDYLFKLDCKLIIIACNTVSAKALRKIQMEHLPKAYPDRRVLGVLIPAAEEAAEATKNKRIGIIATESTVNSKAFLREINKLDSEIKLVQKSAPLLVPLIENGGAKWVGPILDEYLKPLLKANIDTLVLGCTHYSYIKKEIKKRIGNIKLISQDEVVPTKLADYLNRHPEIERTLSRRKKYRFLISDLTENWRTLTRRLFKDGVKVELCQTPASKKENLQCFNPPI